MSSYSVYVGGITAVQWGVVKLVMRKRAHYVVHIIRCLGECGVLRKV